MKFWYLKSGNNLKGGGIENVQNIHKQYTMARIDMQYAVRHSQRLCKDCVTNYTTAPFYLFFHRFQFLFCLFDLILYVTRTKLGLIFLLKDKTQ